MKKILASPFLHFMALGVGIFLLYGWLNRDANHPDGYMIHISEDRQIQLAIAHERNFGTLPDPSTMEKLIAAEIKSEIYYREALRLGLDENDEIIRRRLKQKYEFLDKDNALAIDPTPADLYAYYQKQKDDYLRPAKYSFIHVYFSPDTRIDPVKDAQAFIANPSLSVDPFHISSPKSNRTLNDLRNEFGLAFAQGLSQIEVLDQWHYLESGFGHHVIRMSKISEAQPYSYEEVQEEVKSAYLAFMTQERNNQAYEELKKEYMVEIQSLD